MFFSLGSKGINLPILDVSLSRIQELLGKRITLEELEDLLFRFGMELDSYEKINGDYMLKIEITPDRPDMLSPIGLARALRMYVGMDEPKKYVVEKGDYAFIIDSSVAEIRPYIAGVVVKKVPMNQEFLEEIIYVQEKLHDTFCRGRKKASIGLYPLHKLKWPIRYTTEDPEKIKFRPLDTLEEMTGKEILEKHPTGIKYAHLLKNARRYPLLIDAENHILSMPPIINSEDYGKIDATTRDLLVEVTGTHKPTVEMVINILATMFADAGGELITVKIKYPDKTEESPYFKYRKLSVSLKQIEDLLGLKISASDAVKLLKRMGYFAKETNNELIEVEVPPYRTDIWHVVDVIDDVARAYCYDNIQPELTPIFTVGGETKRQEMIDTVREVLLGLGFSELFTSALTSFEDQFTKMRLPEKREIVIAEAKEAKIQTIRYWLLPEILKSLSYNRRKKLPFKVFEVSDVVIRDDKFETRAYNETHVAVVIVDPNVTFTDIKAVAEHLLNALGVKYELKRVHHPSFIEGRVVGVYVNGKEVGFFGELHPEVLLNWKLTFPTVAMELSLDKIFGWEPRLLEIA